MSAAELIEQIEALLPEEQEVVRNFVLNGDVASGEPQIRSVSNEEARQITDRVFETHAELFRKLAQ